MTTPDVQERIAAIETTLSSVETVLDLPALRAGIADFEAQASVPNLWDDPEAAQKVTSRLSFLQGELRRVEGLRSRLDDMPILFELQCYAVADANWQRRLGKPDPCRHSRQNSDDQSQIDGDSSGACMQFLSRMSERCPRHHGQCHQSDRASHPKVLRGGHADCSRQQDFGR